MRQAGVLAAAGIVALESMPARLVEDHARAARLAQGLSALPGLSLPLGQPQTNMVFVELDASLGLSARQAAAALKELGVLVGVTAERRFRLVTHCWIADEDIQRAVQAFQAVLQPGAEIHKGLA
jgi:threonine aldolase